MLCLPPEKFSSTTSASRPIRPTDAFSNLRRVELMRHLKALAAIIAALFFGAVAATLLTGCQPAKPKIGTAVGTTSTTTDSPEITIPKTEIKDEKPDEEKSSEKQRVLPAGE